MSCGKAENWSDGDDVKNCRTVTLMRFCVKTLHVRPHIKKEQWEHASSMQAIASSDDGLIERHSKSRKRQGWKKDREIGGWRAGGVEEQRDTSID